MGCGASIPTSTDRIARRSNSGVWRLTELVPEEETANTVISREHEATTPGGDAPPTAAASLPPAVAVAVSRVWDDADIERLRSDARGAGKQAQIAGISLAEFQQPVSCCNITALAYAFTALGVPTSVDDIFSKARLPTSFVINDGMTLAETFDAACRFICGARAPFFVECYHFDEGVVDEAAFWKAAKAETRDASDIWVLNFSVKIAHGRDTGGGHFSLLLSAENTDPKDLSKGEVIMADVHPQKVRLPRLQKTRGNALPPSRASAASSWLLLF